MTAPQPPLTFRTIRPSRRRFIAVLLLSLKQIYEANGLDLMRFHATHFNAATQPKKPTE